MSCHDLFLFVPSFSVDLSCANHNQWFYLAQIAYKGTIWPAKLSILILYNRVFGDTTQQVNSFGIRLRTSLVVLMSTGISFFFISEIVTICTCVPVQRYWDKSVEGKCEIDTLGWWYVYMLISHIFFATC